MSDTMQVEKEETNSYINESDIDGLTPEMMAFMAAQHFRFRQEDAEQDQEVQEHVPVTEQNDAREDDPVEMAQKKKKQLNRFKKKTMGVAKVEIPGHTLRYATRGGVEMGLAILDSIATLYHLEPQPDEPQITANAHQKAGSGGNMNE